MSSLLFPRAGFLQFGITLGDPAANVRKAAGMLAKLAPPPDSLLLLPELWATGFDYGHAAQLADQTPTVLDKMTELAARHGVHLAGSFLEKEATDAQAVEKMRALGRGCGSNVEIMEENHHDLVLAITSQLPHLIAYCIVDTANGLEDSTRSEVIKFSASGFRDVTRIAASDPVMWRDIFLNNRDAVLEMLGRFNEDLTALQRAIRWGEGDKLFEVFSRTRAVRRAIIDAKQA